MDNPLTLKIVSLGLILACVIVIVLFIIFVHTMPGKIAKQRNNPQTEAIEILSLLGLIIFPLWMAALVWAYMRPFRIPVVMQGSEPILSERGAADRSVVPESTAMATASSVREQDSDTTPLPEMALDPQRDGIPEPLSNQGIGPVAATG